MQNLALTGSRADVVPKRRQAGAKKINDGGGNGVRKLEGSFGGRIVFQWSKGAMTTVPQGERKWKGGQLLQVVQVVERKCTGRT